MDLHPILRLYTILLSLLPPRYRDEFGEEMKVVFAQALADAAQGGWLAALVMLLREMWDMPRLAIQERWRERKLPPYVSPHGSIPSTPPISKWALCASLALFLIPALLSALAQVAPTRTIGPVAIALLLVVSIGALVGLRKDFIPWTLPWIGLAGGQIGLYMMPQLMAFFASIARIELQRLSELNTLIPRLTWQWVTSGLLWACMAATPAACLVILAVMPRARPLLQRFREDWTLFSFMLYGATLTMILLDLDEYRYDEGFQAAIFLTLAAGAWGYLRWRGRPARVASLLAAITVAMLLMGVGKFTLLPAQNWTEWFERHPVESERWFEALRTGASWFWTVIALLSPWLIRRRPPVFLANLALCVLFLFLFRPVYPYLEIIFSRQEFRLNQLALIGVIGLLIYQIRHAGLKFHFGFPPALHPLALTMLIGSSALFILAERLVDINTLSASLFGLAFYGLLGLWLDTGRWRHGLPAALLLIGTLPFGEHLQTFVGYPVRLLTAVLVRDGLAAFGVHSIGVDTILVFENGVSQVDLPCSGVKSLWTGGMFLLAATWIERRRFNRRWLFVAIVFAFLLFMANLARVAILITVGQAFGWLLLAEMLHVPLGVLGFCGACLALVWMLRKFVAFQNDFAPQPNQLQRTVTGLTSPRWLSPTLFVIILLLAALYTPRPEVAAAQTATPLIFSEKLTTEPWTFSPGEMAWLSADGPLAASRWRFQYGDYRGSLLLITSDTWRAHHRPERCFEAYGLTVNQSRSLLLSNDFPVRLLSLGAGSSRNRATAIYWLQSRERVTDDYATRIWSDLSPNRRTWVLVTILFDQSVEPLDAGLQDLYAGLRQSVARSLETGGPQ